MKTLFLRSKYKDLVKIPLDIIAKLPKTIALATTIQYIDSIESIKSELEDNGKKVILIQGQHSSHQGQMLGCDITPSFIPKLKKKKFDAFLFIGDGMFHPKLLLFIQKEEHRDVMIFNPMNQEFRKIKQSETKEIERRYKGALLKFHTSENIGIIVSTKPGQQRLKKAQELKKKITKKGKNAYIFLCNTLDFSQLENFNFVDCYINTMCPRIGYDDLVRLEKPMLNYEELEEQL
jgi:2-(3-amino-3-carboxypropyl)histidine synthase